MPANKRKSKSTTKAKAKPNVRGVLIQREIPTIPHGTHGIPFISNFHRGEAVKAELVMAGLPPILPPTGFWRDYKFSTYSTKLVEPEFVTTIQNLEGRYCQACRVKDWKLFSLIALQLVDLTTDGGWSYAQYRYDKLLFLDFQFPEYNSPLSATSIRLLEGMACNDHEDSFFRAYATHLLARSHIFGGYDDQDEEEKWAHKEVLLYCLTAFKVQSEAVSSECRDRNIERYEKKVAIGELLDAILEAWKYDEELCEDYLSVQIELHKENDEVERQYRKTKVEEVFPEPVTLDRKLLESVANLPELESCYLVVKLDLSDDEKYHLGEYYGDGHKKRLEEGQKYAVFTVNQKNFIKGKRRRVFDLVQRCLLAESDPLPKKVLAPLAVACLQPYQVIIPCRENRKHAQEPARPKKVLFAAEEEASHQQVRLFMSMMGFKLAEVEVADRQLIQLLIETSDGITAPSKKEFPHLHDEAKGIECGGCGKVGNSLQRCPCKKAYYCSHQCQTEKWPSHKADHKQEMARREAN